MIAPDLKDVATVVAAKGSRLGKPIEVMASTGSTNDDAKAGAKSGAPHGAVWVAEQQTSGRGRQGRSWISPAGENLLFSVLLRVSCAPARVPPLALVCGLAVRDAIARRVSVDVGIKWPNDVVVDGQKIAGILVESALSGSKVEYVIAGIGVNVHTRELPPELAATSISLLGGETHRAELLADILANLDHDVEHVAHRGLGIVHARLAKHDALKGRAVEGETSGVAEGIDPDGRLIVRRPDNTLVKVMAGEVRPVR